MSFFDTTVCFRGKRFHREIPAILSERFSHEYPSSHHFIRSAITKLARERLSKAEFEALCAAYGGAE